MPVDAPTCIVLAEAEPARLEAIRRALEGVAARWHLQVAGSMREYHQALAAKRPDLLIMDLTSPGARQGRVSLEVLSRTDFPIVAMTDRREEVPPGTEPKSRTLDCSVSLPGDVADISRIVASVLAVPRTSGELGKAQDLPGHSPERAGAKDGSTFPVQMDVVSVFDASGAPQYRIDTAQDITERKRAEAEMRQRMELQDQLAKVASTAPGLICSFRLRPDGSACMPFVTPMIEEVSGLRPEDVQEDFAPALARFHPEDVGPFQESVAESARTLKPWRHRFRVLHPAKGERWLEGHTVPQAQVDGGTLWHGYVQDVTDLWQTERALRESEERLRLLGDHIPDGFIYQIIQEPGGRTRYTYISAGVEKTLGIPPDRVLADAHSLWRLIAKQDLPGLIQAQAASAKELSIFDREFRCRTADGLAKWMHARSSPRRTDDGSILWDGVATEVTDRKQAEETLLHRLALQDQMSKIVATVPGMVFSFRLRPDGSTCLPFASPMIEKLWGLRPEEVQEDFSEGFARIWPEDVARVREGILQSARTMLHWRDSFRVRHPERGVIWVEGHSVPRREADGNVLWDGFVQDVSERVQAEQRLRDSELRLSLALEAAGMGMWDWDLLSGRVIWSEAHETLWGYAPGEFPGNAEGFTSRVHPDDLPGIWRAGLEADRGGTFFQVEFRVIRPDGSVRWVASHGRHVYDDTGRAVRRTGVVFDITERKQAENLARTQHNLALALAATDNLDEGLRLCLQAVVEATPLDCGGFYLLDEQTGDLSLYAHRGLSPAFVESVAFYDACSPQARLSALGEPVYTRELDVGVALSELQRREGIRFLAVVPVRREGRVIGCLNAASHTCETLAPVFHELLETIAAGAAHALARLKAERSLRQSEERLRLAMGAANLGTWDVDLTKPRRPNRWSDEYCRLYGRTRDQTPADEEEFLTCVYPDDRPLVRHHFGQALLGDAPYQYEFRVLWPDGSVRWHAAAGRVLKDAQGCPVRMIGVGMDITRRKQAEASLQESREQLRALSARIESLREEERTRISREIHDEMGQMLSGLKMDLRWIEQDLEQAADARFSPTLERVVAATQLTDEAVKTVQRIAAELRPGILDRLGLVMALKYEAKQFQQRTGLACRIETPGVELSLSSEASTIFFRSCQEALTNVSRHAQATQVDICLELAADDLALEVRDNGRGIRQAELEDPRSLGLLGMRERARQLGGKVSVRAGASGGTVVRLQAPRARIEGGNP